MSTSQRGELVESGMAETPERAHDPLGNLEPGRPEAEGRPTVFLLDASSALERRLLLRWIDRHAPSDAQVGSYETIPIRG